jgi:hypothetical protein
MDGCKKEAAPFALAWEVVVKELYAAVELCVSLGGDVDVVVGHARPKERHGDPLADEGHVVRLAALDSVDRHLEAWEVIEDGVRIAGRDADD